MPNAAHSSSRANTELTETHAQLSGERTGGSFCPLSRTCTGTGVSVLCCTLKQQQWDQPSLLRLHLCALSSSPSACEGSLHRIVTHSFVYSGFCTNESPESLIFRPAQGMLHCVPSPVHGYFLIFEYLTGVRSCCCPFRCCLSLLF